MVKYQQEWPILDRSKRPVGNWGVDLRLKFDVDVNKAFNAPRDESSHNVSESGGDSTQRAAESECGDGEAKTDLETETEVDVE